MKASIGAIQPIYKQKDDKQSPDNDMALLRGAKGGGGGGGGGG